MRQEVLEQTEQTTEYTDLFSIKEKKNQEHFQSSGQGWVGVALPFTEIGKKICAQRAVSRIKSSDVGMLS